MHNNERGVNVTSEQASLFYSGQRKILSIEKWNLSIPENFQHCLGFTLTVRSASVPMSVLLTGDGEEILRLIPL